MKVLNENNYMNENRFCAHSVGQKTSNTVLTIFSTLVRRSTWVLGVLRQQLFAESILCTLVSDDVLIDAEVIQPELGTQCSHQRIVCMAGLRSAMAVQATVASVCFILLCWSSCVQFPSFSIFEGGVARPWRWAGQQTRGSERPQDQPQRCYKVYD